MRQYRALSIEFVQNRNWKGFAMDAPDYSSRFDAAVAHAFASSDAGVRRAYLDLADFYRRKLSERLNIYPSPELLNKAVGAA